MKLFEFYDHDQSDEDYQDQEADNSVPELGELRKTKLTLKQPLTSSWSDNTPFIKSIGDGVKRT